MRYKELADGFKGSNVIGIPTIWHTSRVPAERTGYPRRAVLPLRGDLPQPWPSENDDGPLSMNRHVHMGPRTGETTYEKGLNRGYKVGIIAAGDNHSVPGVFEHGSMCALATDNTKGGHLGRVCEPPRLRGVPEPHRGGITRWTASLWAARWRPAARWSWNST